MSEARPTLANSYDSLAKLSANWDGHGSPPIKDVALAAAQSLTAAVESPAIPVPTICPVSGGGVGITWQKAGRELEIEILPDGQVHFLLAWSGPLAPTESQPQGPPASGMSEQVRRLVSWVFAEPAAATASPAPALDNASTEENFHPDVEIPWVPAVPPVPGVRVTGNVRGARPARYDLGIADSELRSLLETGDE